MIRRARSTSVETTLPWRDISRPSLRAIAHLDSRRIVQQLRPLLQILLKVGGVVDLAVTVPNRGEMMMHAWSFEDEDMPAVFLVGQLHRAHVIGGIEDKREAYRLVIRLIVV